MLTRRRLLQAAAGAFAAAAWPRTAAAAQPGSFVLDLGPLPASGAWRTLPPRRAPRAFDLIGFGWASGGHARVEVRAGDGPWVALHAAEDGATAGTEPCWTGRASQFQVRYRGAPGRLQARFVQVAPVAGAAQRRAVKAQDGAPAMFLRADWGGDRYPPKQPPIYGDVQAAFVHHTVSANDYGPGDSASMVLGICQYHRDHNGWNDIGYNFLVDRYGQIFEGRAGGIDQAVIGAQAQGYNSQSTGIANLGDFSSTQQSAQGVEALARLIAWKLSLHGVPCLGEVTLTSGGGADNRYRAGTPVTVQRISGHRDGDSTACPGDALYAQLPALRRRAAALATPVSAVTLRSPATVVRVDAPLALSGALRFADGASAAGLPVQVQFQTAGSAWQVLATTPAAGDGTWTASIAPPLSGRLRAAYPGDSAHAPMATSAIAVRVLPRLDLSLASARAATGTRVAVTGTLRPAGPSRVLLRFERRVRGRWVPVQTKRVAVHPVNGFASVVRPRVPGLYRVTVAAPGAVASRRLRATGA